MMITDSLNLPRMFVQALWLSLVFLPPYSYSIAPPELLDLGFDNTYRRIIKCCEHSATSGDVWK